MLAKNIGEFINPQWVCGEIPKNISISGLNLHSKKIAANEAFIALKGESSNGMLYVEDAKKHGATLLIADVESADNLQELPLPVLWIKDLPNRLAQIADTFYETPSEKIKLVGVTGTNGKTSISWALTDVCNQQAIKAVFVGTLGMGNTQSYIAGDNTTPDIVSIQKALHAFYENGITHVFIEVSSIGLAQDRVKGLRFSGAVFSNLSHDHLDFHKTFSAYEKEKIRLFTEFAPSWSVVNADDVSGQKIIHALGQENILTYSLNDKYADLCLELIERQTHKLRVKAYSKDVLLGEYSFPVMATFELQNNAAVVLSLVSLGVAMVDALSWVAHASTPPGRLQQVIVSNGAQKPQVYIDYAHTPDAVEKVLSDLRKHTQAKLISVVGCGGNRDVEKRAQMGFIATKKSDVVYLTSDNPRFEKAGDIILAMQEKLAPSDAVICEQDRKRAIEQAIYSASANDAVLIAGKGHENYQEVNGQREFFSDYAIAQAVLEQWPERGTYGSV